MVAQGGEFPCALCYTQFTCRYSGAVAPPDFKIATCFLAAHVTKPADPFQVMPRRWIVQRTIAWISSSRRLAPGLHAHRYESGSCSGRNGAHQRRGVDLIGHGGLCHIDDCEEQELRVVENRETLHLGGGKGE